MQFWCLKVVQKSNRRRKSTCYYQRNQDQREASWSGHPGCYVRAGSWPCSWCLSPLSQLVWDYHRAPMQIYLHALILPFHPLVSTETFPWHLAVTSRELCPVGLSQRRRDGKRASLLGAGSGAHHSVEGYGGVVALVTPMLCTVCTYVWCVPLTQTLSLPPFPQ